MQQQVHRARICWQLIAALALFSAASAMARQSCDAPRYDWTRSFGANRSEYPTTVAIQPSGAIVSGGEFGNSGLRPGYELDFDPLGKGDVKLGFGGQDAFVTASSADGAYLWTITFGGDGDEDVDEIAVDEAGWIWISGGFGRQIGDNANAVDFDPGPGEDIRVCPYGSYCSYVTYYGQTGEYLGTWTIGDEGGQISSDHIAIDASGNLYVEGIFWQGAFDFDPGPGEDWREQGSRPRWYVTKFFSDLNYAWTIELEVGPSDIGLDGDGNLYITGEYDSDHVYDFDPGPGEDLHGGDHMGDKVFVTRINADLSYGWTQVIARADDSIFVRELAVDRHGAYVAGYFREQATFDPDGKADQKDDPGRSAAWLVRVDLRGGYRWAHVITGSDGSKHAGTVVADGEGSIYLAGDFAGNINFDPDGDGDWHLGVGNGSNTFVTKLGYDKTYYWTRFIEGPGWSTPNAMCAASVGRIIVDGDFHSSAEDFDPTEGQDVRRDNGGGDVFISAWQCGGCDAISSHGLQLLPNGDVVSTVVSDQPGGTIKIRTISGDAKRLQRVRIDATGRIVVPFSDLPSGRCDVVIKWIKDASGNRLCTGPLMERSIVVP